MSGENHASLIARNRELASRLEEAEEALRAIRSGEVDAVVAAGSDGDAVYTLRGADQIYRLLIEQMSEGAVTIAPDGLILYANEQMASMIGIPLEHIIGARLQSFVAAGSRAVFEALLRDGEGGRFELQFERGDGRLTPAYLSVGRVRQDAVETIVIVITDLTEQKRSQEIVAAGKLARSILDHACTAILVLDARGRIIQANRAAEELAGQPVLLRPLSSVFDLASAPSSDTLGFEQIVFPLLRQGSISGLQAVLRRPKGDSVSLVLNAGLLAGDDDDIAAYIVTLADISELTRAQDEIRTLNADLENRVRQRTAQLEASNRELDAFAHSVAHDLRSPLRTIDGWSYALLKDYGDRLDEQGRGYLARVRAEAQRMGLLIADLLTLSRVMRADMESAPVDLTSLAREAIAKLREAHPGRSIEFIVSPGLAATGHPGLLGIVMTNLLDNAVKFTGTRDQARIEVGRCADLTGSPFFVRDNGVGFDMTFVDTLFHSFHRLHSPSQFPGHGIGLAMVDRIIRRHGGRIWAEAAPEAGATFFFVLGAAAAGCERKDAARA